MRPINSNRSAPTENLAKWLVSIFEKLNPPEGLSVKNTVEFVDKVKDTFIRPNDILASFDVESLYPSIPVGEALDLLRVWLAEQDLSVEE